MGRKSRSSKKHKKALKRKTKLEKPSKKKQIIKNWIAEDIIESTREKLIRLYANYNPVDIYLSLTISELWLPNISSQLKHSLALNIFLSMSESDFKHTNKVNTYNEFKELFSSIYDCLPDFPMLEDYVPTQDWADIKIIWQEEIYSIFYGSFVERLVDFIEAFQVRYANYPEALKQMENVLKLQDNFLFDWNKKHLRSFKKISAGHIEVPTEDFWVECKEKLEEITSLFNKITTDVASSFVAQLGEVKGIKTQEEFGQISFEGVLNPIIGLSIDGIIYPISFRNMPIVVIESYANRYEKIEIEESLNWFLFLRYEMAFDGPFHLIDLKGTSSNHKFIAYLQTNNKIYFFVLWDEHNFNFGSPTNLAPETLFDSKDESELLENLEIREDSVTHPLESEIREILNGEQWGVRPIKGDQYIELKNELNEYPTRDHIEIIAINPKLTTANVFLTLPETAISTHFMGLVDFITLFDSIRDMNEFGEFIEYKDKYYFQIRMAMTGLIDLYASFKYTHSVLIDGATNPDMVFLGVSDGDDWRFKQLKEFWKNTPNTFPDYSTRWVADGGYDGNIRLIAKNNLVLNYSTSINNSDIHFYGQFKSIIHNEVNCRVFSIFIEAICDALSQRSAILEELDFQGVKKVTVICSVNSTNLIKEDVPLQDKKGYLFEEIYLERLQKNEALIKLTPNLPLILSYLTDPKDALLQAKLTQAFMQFLDDEEIIKNYSAECVNQIMESKNRQPRMLIEQLVVEYDTPSIKPLSIEEKHYLLARKSLAELFKEHNIEPGRYELNEAKKVINQISSLYRDEIHCKLIKFNQQALIKQIIEYHDANEHHKFNAQKSVDLSLRHEVSYSREKKLNDINKEYTRISMNYRYLIECALNLNSKSTVSPNYEDIKSLIAYIDWLFVLYNASDILHYDLDIGGIVIDNDYRPEVFYSEDREDKEKVFFEKQASYQLGIELITDDTVNSTIVSENGGFGGLDKVFEQDLGFKYSNLLAVTMILSQWARCTGQELQLSYSDNIDNLINIIEKNGTQLLQGEVKKIVEFLTLDPVRVRRLLDSDNDEFDIPVGDHNKRDHRYNIRPLIRFENQVIWGATAMYRTHMIWMQHISEGYLPADFNVPNIQLEVRNIKESIEKGLENKTFKIVARFAPYVKEGIDFRRSFPKKRFDDVGDFDTLAYFPEKNLLISFECKYNQPAFCVKDLKRLRERIFGRNNKRGQIGKIEGREVFLQKNHINIFELLGWNRLIKNSMPEIINVYVCRDIYWWMENPPYETNVNFVRVDNLHSYLGSVLGNSINE